MRIRYAGEKVASEILESDSLFAWNQELLFMLGSIEAFEKEVIPKIHKQFQKTPAHYHNEQEIHPYIISELQRQLSPSTAGVEYRYDHLDVNSRGHPEEFKDLDLTQIRRVQSEAKFYDPDSPDDMTDVDFAVLPQSGGIVQAKKQGVGKYIDIQSDIEFIGEIKHSKNRDSDLYGKGAGLQDIERMDNLPINAEMRYFVFVDWWPTDENGKKTFTSDWKKLQSSLGNLKNEINVIYLGRNGEFKSKVLTN